MRPCPLACVLALAACSNSRSTGAAVYAEATIGPEGGVVVAGSGPLAGLRLTVPPGALAAPTVVRVRDVPGQPPGPAVIEGAPPGRAFVIEPAGLRLEQRALLHVPFLPQNLRETAPGNVRLRERRNGNVIDYEPEVVDVAQRFVEAPIRWFSEYVVVSGPVAGGIAAYQPAEGAVALAGDVVFAVEPVPPESPFAAAGAMRWRITSPGREDVLYFAGELLVGREAPLPAEGWRERWQTPQRVWIGPPGAGTTLGIDVERPIGALSVGGALTFAADWSWSDPRTIAGRQLFDLVQLRLQLAWNRQDLGVGQREYRFWFAPGVGLVALGEDGVVVDKLAW